MYQNQIYMKIAYSILALVLFGALYQYIMTKIEERLYNPPGRMVDIGGYNLHINEQGAEHNGPIIVLDMGIGGNNLYWYEVQTEIAKFAHVVSFDRAGLGWSDRSPNPRSSYNIIEETRNLLMAAGLKGPFIFVGHSFGGLNARIYAKKYPKEVAGIILVDSSHEEQNKDLPKSKFFMNQILDKTYLHPLIAGLSRIGFIRLYRFLSSDNKNFKPEIYEASKAKESSNKFIDTLLEEWGMFDKNLEYTKRFDYSLGNLPLTVITASMDISKEACDLHGHYDMERCKYAYKIWHELQGDLVKRSTNSKQILARKSAHIIHQYEPELIVEAAREMIKHINDRLQNTSKMIE